MEINYSMKLPASIRSKVRESHKLPENSRYAIRYARVEFSLWPQGRMLRQITTGYLFLMELFEAHLTNRLHIRIELNKPCVLFYYSFKGQINSVHKETGSKITFSSGEYGPVHAPAGTYKVTIPKGHTLTFLYVFDSGYLNSIITQDAKFASLGSLLQADVTCYKKSQFCQIGYSAGRIIQQLRILNQQGQALLVAIKLRLLSLLLEYEKQVSRQENITSQTSIEKIVNIRDFILQRIRNSPVPSIKNLAEMFGIGERTLRRKFKELQGVSLNDFIHHARMQQGLHLLKSMATVTDVSRHLGYASVAAFSKSFTKYHGFPPGSVNKN